MGLEWPTAEPEATVQHTEEAQQQALRSGLAAHRIISCGQGEGNWLFLSSLVKKIYKTTQHHRIPISVEPSEGDWRPAAGDTDEGKTDANMPLQLSRMVSLEILTPASVWGKANTSHDRQF